jgi:hypothetical protein
MVKSTIVRAIQQATLSSVVGVTSTVPKLPDRLVILKKLRGEENAESVDLDLAALFD